MIPRKFRCRYRQRICRSLPPGGKKGSSRSSMLAVFIVLILSFWGSGSLESPVLKSDFRSGGFGLVFPASGPVLQPVGLHFDTLQPFCLCDDSVPAEDSWDLYKLTFLQLVDEYATFHHLVIYNPMNLKGCRLAGHLVKRMPPQEFVEDAINGCLAYCISAELRHDTIELKPPTQEGIKRYQDWLEWRKKHL
jgi:hypothetical protein